MYFTLYTHTYYNSDFSLPQYLTTSIFHRTLNLLFHTINVNEAKTTDECTPLYTATEKGHVDIVKLLLDVPGIDINKKLKGKFSPLMKAKKKKHDEIIQLLTDAGAQ